MPEMNSTEDWGLTEDHFEIFKAEFIHWANRLGLFDYEITFFFKEDEKDRAFVIGNLESRAVQVTLSTIWKNYTPADKERDLCHVAFHECMEVFLYNLSGFARMDAAKTTRCEINTEIHRVIRTLENVWFRSDWEKRHWDHIVDDSVTIHPDALMHGTRIYPKWDAMKPCKNEQTG